MYKIALIGWGKWGKVLFPHLQARFDVKYIFGRSLQRKGIFTNDLDEALSGNVDAVIVATPIDTHLEIVYQALKNKKHVFCEKPLTTDPDSAMKLIKLADSNDIRLVTDYTYTFSPRLLGLRDYLEQMNITVNQIDFTLTRTDEIKGRDIRWTLACHALSILGIFADFKRLCFRARESSTSYSLFYSGAFLGISTVAMGLKRNETFLYVKTDKLSIHLDRLNEDDNIGHALDYFIGVLDGKHSNNKNSYCAYQITKILSELG